MRRCTWAMLAVMATLTTGCSWQSMRWSRQQAPAPPEPATANATTAPAASRIPKAPEGPTPVEKALEMQRKLEECEKQLAQARQRVQTLETQNAELTSQKVGATMELNQARRELDDANLMLREMKTELTRWKKDVLGFRAEMREAQSAQLDALHRVLKVLGAEEPRTAAGTPATPPALSSALPAPAAGASAGN